MPRSTVGHVVERFVKRKFRRQKLYDFADSWSDEPTEVETRKTMKEMIVDELGSDDFRPQRP